MQSFDAVQAARHALKLIEDGGYSIESTSDFSQLPEIVASTGKPYLSPLLSPKNQDYSSHTAFWLVLRDNEGSRFGCVGARLENLEPGELSGYWRRVFSRHYTDQADSLEISLCASARSVLAGRLAYIGDLYVGVPEGGGGLGRANQKRLAALLHLMHALVALEWQVNAAYSFISARDALRGAGTQYGFTQQFPMQKGWQGNPPPHRYDDEWLVILPAADRSAVFRQLVWSSAK